MSRPIFWRKENSFFDLPIFWKSGLISFPKTQSQNAIKEAFFLFNFFSIMIKEGMELGKQYLGLFTDIETVYMPVFNTEIDAMFSIQWTKSIPKPESERNKMLIFEFARLTPDSPTITIINLQKIAFEGIEGKIRQWFGKGEGRIFITDEKVKLAYKDTFNMLFDFKMTVPAELEGINLAKRKVVFDLNGDNLDGISLFATNVRLV